MSRGNTYKQQSEQEIVLLLLEVFDGIPLLIDFTNIPGVNRILEGGKRYIISVRLNKQRGDGLSLAVPSIKTPADICK